MKQGFHLLACAQAAPNRAMRLRTDGKI